jgi:prepilin-type N-terminal cleavage/methylation domain-containing protein
MEEMIKLRHIYKKIRGFTLIELMVAIGLMLMIFTVALPNYRSYQRSKALDKAYQEIVADFRLAQENAISGVKPQVSGNPCLTSVLEKYLVQRINSTTYNLYARCGGVNFLVKNVDTQENGVTISNFGTIGFKVLGEGTDFTSDKVITITQTGTGLTKTVTVTTGGEIH